MRKKKMSSRMKTKKRMTNRKQAKLNKTNARMIAQLMSWLIQG